MVRARVGIVDYRAGNVRSIANAFEFLGADVITVRGAQEMNGCTHLVLPGVGAFGHCADNLRASGLLPALNDSVRGGGVPMLCICVGMQLLADVGEELGEHAGLGWIPGGVRRLWVTGGRSRARTCEAQFADEPILLSIDSTLICAGAPLLEVLGRAASEPFMPLAVGGGVRSVADFELLLEGGAYKVCVNSAALERPALIDEAASVYGAQCVVLAIDYRRDADGVPRVFRNGGLTATALDAGAWALEAARRGAGELMLTDIDRDGAGGGLDVDLLDRVCAKVAVPMIASGSCGLAQHIVEGLAAGAEAVAAGTFFALRDQNPMQTRAHVRNASVPVRLST